MLNMSYRETMFQLTFVGSDDVVRALNDLMQHFYRAGPNPQDLAEHGKEMARLLARLLLAIRRGGGQRHNGTRQVCDAGAVHERCEGTTGG